MHSGDVLGLGTRKGDSCSLLRAPTNCGASQLEHIARHRLIVINIAGLVSVGIAE
jgi:hypothetical protein